ncbi:DUF3667 domain-containing protein [Luteimonas aquatica]|uniref:DUF3667 domain-containing protein n=1 Tax=Luteimonas aquatica TaxID=450364 RepID=UPI001F59D201|nr:DUF3667 domain-containing protein [Luteimonas aquatica]
MTEHTVPADAGTPAACEHCATPLQGHFCHRCGQSAHNPLKHFAHAVEEVFESFWHLDGRIFRTLRGLLAPGRVAAEYLGGHRVCYVPPLRLFVILSLLTFFVGKLIVHVESDQRVVVDSSDAIARAQTAAEVRRARDGAIGRVQQALADAERTPGVEIALRTAQATIRERAAARLAELEPGAATGGTHAPADAHGPTGGNKTDQAWQDGFWSFNGKPWNAQTNPVDVGWWPDFANRWLNTRIGKAKANIARMGGHADLYIQAFLGAVPTALFLLMPVFALLLKLLYLGSGRSYLEHLVVALYSHAYLLLTLLAAFVLFALGSIASAPWLATLTGLCGSALWLWTPLYLLLMQRRVYGGGWPGLLSRYAVIGLIYTVLVVFASLYAAVAGLSS